MRKLLTLSLFLICNMTFAQWEQVFPLPADPVAVSVADDTTVYIITSRGFESSLYRSYDAANTWDKVSDAPAQISQIFFVNKVEGVASAGNKIYKTIDGGITWTNTTLPLTASVTAIQFPSPDVGYITTAGNGVFKTVDAGLTWKALPGSPAMTLNYAKAPLSFFNDLVGYVVTESKLYRTEDGGANWNAIEMFAVRDVFAADEKVVYVGTNYETKKSIDGGQNWTQHYYWESVPLYPPGKRGLLFADYSEILRADNTDANFTLAYQSDFTFPWRKISMAGKLIVGIGQDRGIVRSMDAGDTWTLVSCRPQHGSFSDAYFINDKEGFIAGDNFGFLKTNNNGASWYAPETPGRHDFYQIAFCHPDTGIVVVTNNYAMTTHDGGKSLDFGSWTPPIVGHLGSTDYEMVTAKIIYTTGSGGKIAKSVDGGASWTTKSFDFSNALYSIDCLNRDTCHAAGAVGKIVSTWNGGASWTIQNDIPVNQNLIKVYMLNSLVGFASGTNVIVRTVDGGHTWSVLNVSGGAAVSFMFTSDNTGYAVTQWGYILKTIDQGASWKTVYTPPSFFLEIKTATLRDSTILAVSPYEIYSMHLSKLVENPDPDPDPNPVGVEKDAGDVSLHPNPTDGLLYIKIPERLVDVTLYDLRGNLLHRYQNPESPLAIYDLPAGLYIVRAQGKSKSWTGKIIKK